MKNILDEIRNQPPHIREIFMWVCVVITFSVIGFAWFRATSREFLALLNPELQETKTLAQKGKNQPSPFATLFGAAKDLQAGIWELFDLSGQNDFEILNGSRTDVIQPIIPQKLPLSEDKK